MNKLVKNTNETVQLEDFQMQDLNTVSKFTVTNSPSNETMLKMATTPDFQRLKQLRKMAGTQGNSDKNVNELEKAKSQVEQKLAEQLSKIQNVPQET